VGDTGNTASRIASHGAGCIQVTGRTDRRLPGRYRFQRRGPVPVKGMGEMLTYFQLGRNQRSADRPRSAEHTLAGPQNKQHSRQTNTPAALGVR
jgi:class 3 adenylate cyclase